MPDAASCPPGRSNFDEFDLADITDCSIHTQYVKLLYLINIILALLLFSVCTHLMVPQLKRKMFDINYLPHFIVFSFWTYSWIYVVTFTYKIIDYHPLASLDTVALLVMSVFDTFAYISIWSFMVYIMAVSISGEMGGKGKASSIYISAIIS